MKGIDGYVGESTGLETAYALLNNKPIVMLREPRSWSPTIAPLIRSLLERHSSSILVEKIDKLSREKLTERLAEVALTNVDYGLTADETDIVMGGVFALTKKYRRDWDDYLRLRRTGAIG